MNNLPKYNALYLASIPFLGIYRLPIGIPLDWVLVAILFTLNLCHKNLNYFLKVRKNEWNWYLSIICIGFIGLICNCVQDYFSIQLFMTNFFALSIFFWALIFITSSCDKNYFIRCLYIFGLLASFICLFQRIQLMLTGVFLVDVFIPGLEVNREIESFDLTRVSAFFTEPAHLSIYLLPIFYIALNHEKKIFSLIFAGGIIFSGSSTGLLLLVILVFLFLIKSGVSKIYVFISIVAFTIISLLVISFFPDVLLDNINKISGTDFKNGSRLLGPLNHFGLFDFLQLLFGVGFNQLHLFLKVHGITLENDWGIEINANFANAFFYMALSYGLIGLLFFIKYMKRTIEYHLCDLGLVVYSMGILLSDQVLFNRNLLYILSLLLFSKYIIINNKSK